MSGIFDFLGGREEIEVAPPPDPADAEAVTRRERRKVRKSAMAEAARQQFLGPIQLQSPGLKKPRS